MSNMKIKRDHAAKVHLFVSDVPALGAVFNGIAQFGDKQCAVFLVPLGEATFGEVDNVIPFVAVR
jgi:hypothetical protein